MTIGGRVPLNSAGRGHCRFYLKLRKVLTVGLRTIVRKLRKPAVMALVAGSLVLSLTVTTTQRAEATPAVAVLPVIAAAEAIVGGAALPFAMPSLLATSLALHPVGWAIAGASVVIGVGLFATKDYWLPYVQGAFGSPDNDNPATAIGSQQPYITQGLTLTELTISGQTGAYSVKWANNGGSGAYVVAVYVNCRTTAGALSVVNQSLSSTSNAYGQTRSFGISCPSGQTMTGAVAGPGGAHAAFPTRSSAPGPENVMTAGTYSPAGFDPRGADVKYKTTVECINEAGTRASLSAESVGDEGGVKVPSCAAAGLGHGTGKMDIEGYAPTAPGVPGTAPTPLWSAPAPTVAPDHPQRLCDPNRPGDGCKMAITIDGKPCVVGSWECENWADIWRDPNTAPRVGCTYGPYAMAVDLCKVMEPAYRPGGAPANEENTDGDPATRNYTQPGGQPFNPPSTGTGTGVIPGLGGQPGPNASPEEAGCFPTGWAVLNPVEWVMKPVGCALTAAFVPSTEVVQAQQTRIQTKFQNVGFARISGAWLATFESVGGGGGCAGPTVNFSMQGISKSLQPFNACSAPMSTVAGITYAVSAIGIVLFGGLGMIRAVSSAFGFNFSLGKGASE